MKLLCERRACASGGCGSIADDVKNPTYEMRPSLADITQLIDGGNLRIYSCQSSRMDNLPKGIIRRVKQAAVRGCTH